MLNHVKTQARVKWNSSPIGLAMGESKLCPFYIISNIFIANVLVYAYYTLDRDTLHSK
jgi:hypothetical protein